MVGFGRWNRSSSTTLEIGETQIYYMERYGTGTLNKFLSGWANEKLWVWIHNPS